ncbi:3',5'-cyclic-nucleotide phosphodiesterase [Colwellia sp. C1TZA3]|nr:3',5'-cyclic-nucleotide phosphodiesterase [Colwellia sp. C1TZA3]
MSNSSRSKKLTLAQISDSHLFADYNGLHHQANVYQHLKDVLLAIKKQPSVDVIVFTGDLTQDHTPESYQLFVRAFEACEITTPVYYIAGNHDEPLLLSRYLSGGPFCQDNIIENDDWQVLLLESKSATPAGEISKAQFAMAGGTIDPTKAQLLLMHHHPVDVGYFIDQHGLTNPAEFQQFLTDYSSIKAVACGHIHQALSLSIKLPDRTVSLYSCPATSIQFDINAETAKSNGQPPGYRIFTLASNGELTSRVYFV